MHKIFEGLNVCVVGSAPLEASRVLRAGLNRPDAVMSVNGSLHQAIALFPQLPKYATVDQGVFSHDRRLHSLGSRIVLDEKKLTQGIIEHLFVVNSNDDVMDIKPETHCTVRKVTRVSRLNRAKICRKVSSVKVLDESAKSLVGTGIFAILLSLHLGAESVWFEGFRLRSGTTSEYALNYYDTNQRNQNLYQTKEVMDDYWASRPRNHSASDASAIAGAVMRGHRLLSTETEFIPLLTNWGSSPDFEQLLQTSPQVSPLRSNAVLWKSHLADLFR